MFGCVPHQNRSPANHYVNEGLHALGATLGPNPSSNFGSGTTHSHLVEKRNCGQKLRQIKPTEQLVAHRQDPNKYVFTLCFILCPPYIDKVCWMLLPTSTTPVRNGTRKVRISPPPRGSGPKSDGRICVLRVREVKPRLAADVLTEAAGHAVG